MLAKLHWNVANTLTVEFDDGVILEATPIGDMQDAAIQVVEDNSRISEHFLMTLLGRLPNLPRYPYQVPSGAGLRVETVEPRRTIRLRHRVWAQDALDEWTRKHLLRLNA